jgi:hypothetical protein
MLTPRRHSVGEDGALDLVWQAADFRSGEGGAQRSFGFSREASRHAEGLTRPVGCDIRRSFSSMVRRDTPSTRRP